jgi:hypothetical protein
VRQDEAKLIQEMGRSRAYRRWRNRPDGLADAAVSDDESRRPGGANWRGRKGGGGGWRGVFIPAARRRLMQAFKEN